MNRLGRVLTTLLGVGFVGLAVWVAVDAARDREGLTTPGVVFVFMLTIFGMFLIEQRIMREMLAFGLKLLKRGDDPGESDK